MVAVQHLDDDEATPLLPSPHATATALREAAATLSQAATATTRARQRLGIRPRYERAAAEAVERAAADLQTSARTVASERERRHVLLAMGNAAGVGSFLFGIAAVVGGAEPTGNVVGAFIVGAAAGPIGGVVAGRQAVARARAAERAARHELVAALARAGGGTIGEVRAAGLWFEGWRRRRDELDACVAVEERARRRWEALAGPGVAVSALPVLLGSLDAERRARLRQLQSALSALLVARDAAATGATDATAGADGVAGPSDGVRAFLTLVGAPALLALPAPVVEIDVAEREHHGLDLSDAHDDRHGRRHMLDLLDRVRGKGLRLWSA